MANDNILDEIPPIVFGTSEIDVHTLKTGIFFTNASLASPVVVELDRTDPMHNPPKHHYGYQTLIDTFKGGWSENQLKSALSAWGSYAGVVGVGQFSLLRERPAFALARFAIQFRDPSFEEMNFDLHNFGEQVIGEEYDSKNKAMMNEPTLKYLDKEFIYTGPPRISRFLFDTLVRQGKAPNDLSKLVQEIEESALKIPSSEITPQAFHLFQAEKGRLSYAAFSVREKYSPSRLNKHGHIEIKDNKLLYYPLTSVDPAVDFTQELMAE